MVEFEAKAVKTSGSLAFIIERGRQGELQHQQRYKIVATPIGEAQ